MRRRNTLSNIEIERLRNTVAKAIAPLQPPERTRKYKIGSSRTMAGQSLPAHYFVYFLLVELMNFPHTGRGEKVAWTVPVDYDGNFAFIEHRKLGLGVFSIGTEEDERVAALIVDAVRRGVRVATPFFDHLAALAVKRSELNVNNNSKWLFSRYEYLRDRFREKAAEGEARKHEVNVEESVTERGTTIRTYSAPGATLSKEAAWIGVAAIEAFFSWTEHVLILVAILQGKLTTGEQVAKFADAEWGEKVKGSIGLADPNVKTLFDKLLIVRREIRNYMAHGAFGKHGEAFRFHSRAGAVPVNLTDASGRHRFSIWSGPSFVESEAIEVAEAFIEQLWHGDLAPAKLYVEDAGLPVILTFASDGTYDDAMTSDEDMERLIDGLTREMDDAANMDW